MATTYRIVRFYRDDEERNRTVLETGLTLEQAQAHCNNRETSSSTATDPDLSHGPWFDGYEAE
jgi:hypothetical protein